jgi:FtsZ-binding cell division protein ZapB
MSPCLALAQSSQKIDMELQKVLETAPSSELIAIIIVFQDKPTEDQLDTLNTIHKMEITFVYRIINGVAGRAPAEEIPKIAEYEWVKGILLDKKVYTMPDKTIKTSELIEMLQKENDELRENISILNQKVNKLQEQIETEQSKAAQLETNLKIYSSTTFIIGLIAGIASVILIKKQRRVSCSEQMRFLFLLLSER